jgi:L-arabinose isomerase
MSASGSWRKAEGTEEALIGNNENSHVRLGITVVCNPLEVGAQEAPELLQQLEQQFAGQGEGRLTVFRSPVAVTDPASAVKVGKFFYDLRVDAACMLAASWFEDYLVLDLLEECDVPVIAWARPGMETGSLCGMQQLGFILRQLTKPHCFLFDHICAPPALRRAWEFAAAAAVRSQLRRARIGILGRQIQGMMEITGHELALKKLLGPRITGIDTHVFLERASNISSTSVSGRWKDLKAEVGYVTAGDEAGLESLQVYTALKEIIGELGLSAVAAGCYPHLMGKVCLAASLLGEEGIPVSCEGDINGALGMMILTRLTGCPTHNTDLLDPIPAENSIIFSHCGSGGFSLADSPSQVTLGPVRLMNCGLCCLFPARPGPVTLINIVPTLEGYRVAALYGEAIKTDMVFPGNPLRVHFQTDYHEILSWIAEHGLGHHWMAAYGDWRRPLCDLANMTGCEWLTLDWRGEKSEFVSHETDLNHGELEIKFRH